MSLKDNKIKWSHVEKWFERESMKTHWKPWGIPEIVDPRGSAFADVDPMPKWKVPEKIAISATMNGAFFTPAANPNIPTTPAQIIRSAEECIEAGATIIHLHVRDEKGYNVLDVDLFRRVIEPLRERHPDIVIDGCLVAVNDEESQQMEKMMSACLLDSVPINTCAILIGDNMFFKSPHAIIRKARLALEVGLTPQIAVYSDGDIDNARRYLIDSGLLEPPFFWLVLPALPGCSPMYSPESMISGLTRYVGMIREISQDSIISVCAAGRASTYLTTLATLMGLNIRVGMEDTIYKWPHKDDRITSNVEHFKLALTIAQSLGRELMGAKEYLAQIGATPAAELRARMAVARSTR